MTNYDSEIDINSIIETTSKDPNVVGTNQVGFYGFTPDKKSTSLSKNGSYDQKMYQDLTKVISSGICTSNDKAYHINDENWLIDKLNQYKDGNTNILKDMPDLIIVPEDVTFSDNLNNTITSLDTNIQPVKIQYISTKNSEDDSLIYMGDIVGYDSNTNSNYIDLNNSSDFEKATYIFHTNINQSKKAKSAFYCEKNYNIDNTIENEEISRVR